MSLALQFAKPAGPESDMSELMIYDHELQMNVFRKDGRLAIEDKEMLMKLGTTASTAGSKTHFDD